MPLDVNFLPEAWQEYRSQVTYLAVHASLKQAFRFADAVQASVDLLAEMPEISAEFTARRKHLAGVRSWSMKRPFHKYRVYYQAQGANLVVLHVVHSAKDIDAIF